MIMIRNIKRVVLVVLPALIIGFCIGRYLNFAYNDVSSKHFIQQKDLKIFKGIQVNSGKGVQILVYTFFLRVIPCSGWPSVQMMVVASILLIPQLVQYLKYKEQV